ncbi:MAG: SDR family oxidoreductase [Proteobacteria bacterium]|nr:SDR family oxidoreductase [Pseudomonadota bacterium]
MFFDNDKLVNPLKEYYRGSYDWQPQEAPGVQAKMHPIPDCGEKSYVGSGRLEGRKALVTGGDSGIGRAAAIAFAREGADVVINYLPLEEEDAQEVKELIEAEGRKAVLIPGDISSEEFCKALIRKAVDELDGLDILCLVAGKQVAQDDIEKLPTEQFVKTYEVNVFGMMWLVREAMPHLKPGSCIINTTSIQAYQPSEYLLDYAGTKAAIRAFTQGLAKQVASKGIRVNAIAPGPIWTPLQICGGQLKENLPDFGKDAPMKRAGQPVELADVYVFLASEASSYVTGQIYGITGGMPTA